MSLVSRFPLAALICRNCAALVPACFPSLPHPLYRWKALILPPSIVADRPGLT